MKKLRVDHLVNIRDLACSKDCLSHIVKQELMLKLTNELINYVTFFENYNKETGELKVSAEITIEENK